MDDLRRIRRSNEKCVQCGVELDREGRYCIRCNTANNNSKFTIVKELHDNKQCSTCRKPLDRKGWFCTECCNNLKLRARIRSAERRANGECVQCGRKAEGHSYCRRCLDMLKERRNKKN
jgi:predicted amidophosphoribosyltransferase